MSVPQTTTITTSTGRWLGAPQADVQLSGLPLSAQHGSLRETQLRRQLSQLTQQRTERESGSRYRLHGQLAPLSQLAYGSTQWTKLEDLVPQQPGSAAYTQSFFADFAYELLVPVRAEPLADLPDTYQLYYEVVAGVTLDVLAGTVARDPWGGTLFPFTASGPVELAGRTIAGLPVPLPVTQVAVRLVGPAGTQRYDWPATWRGNEQTPDPATPLGFFPAQLTTNEPAVAQWLVTYFKDPSWDTLSDAAYAVSLLGQLIPLWAAYDLAFTEAAVALNADFIAAQLGLTGRGSALVTDPAGELVGPRVRFNPRNDGELVYLSQPRYSYRKEMILADTPAIRDYVSLLGYRHSVRETGGLRVDFRFTWEALHLVKLADFAPELERLPFGTLEPVPDWAWLDEVTNEYVFRRRQPAGILLDGRGVNFPFLNNAHYVYERVAHYVGPDLTDFNAYRAFARVLPSGQLFDATLPPTVLSAR